MTHSLANISLLSGNYFDLNYISLLGPFTRTNTQKLFTFT